MLITMLHFLLNKMAKKLASGAGASVYLSLQARDKRSVGHPDL